MLDYRDSSCPTLPTEDPLMLHIEFPSGTFALNLKSHFLHRPGRDRVTQNRRPNIANEDVTWCGVRDPNIKRMRSTV